MNGFVLTSGILAAVILAGHCTVGRRDYFLPMRAADFDAYARRVMEFIWHLSTAAIALMAAALLAVGLGYVEEGGRLLTWFAVAHFLAWGSVNLLLGLTSGLPRAPVRMFQWMLFFAVAATEAIGATIG